MVKYHKDILPTAVCRKSASLDVSVLPAWMEGQHGVPSISVISVTQSLLAYGVTYCFCHCQNTISSFKHQHPLSQGSRGVHRGFATGGLHPVAERVHWGTAVDNLKPLSAHQQKTPHEGHRGMHRGSVLSKWQLLAPQRMHMGVATSNLNLLPTPHQ